MIAGAEDPAATVDQAEEIRASIPEARLVVIGAAHLANIEQPDAVTREILEHLEPTGRGQKMTSEDSAYDRGMKVRREVLGDEHVDRAIGRTTGVHRGLPGLYNQVRSGGSLARPGLDRRTRSCITLTALVALGRLDELGLHVRAAVRNGLTEQEIGEVFLQSAVYCGVPAATRLRCG